MVDTSPPVTVTTGKLASFKLGNTTYDAWTLDDRYGNYSTSVFRAP